MNTCHMGRVRRSLSASLAGAGIAYICLASTLFSEDRTDLAIEASAAAPELGLVVQQPSDGPFVKTVRGYMVPYEATIPGTDVTFTMVPIPGGKFMMGSPETETGRLEDEGPQFEVEVPPCWMAAYEITWAEYQQFMALEDVFHEFENQGIRPVSEDRPYDAVTAPSRLYDPDTVYESGDDPRQPAVMMTQFAAKQYTKWLSGLTGQFYCLPSEAIWEYACRAGSKTAYSFGEKADDLTLYAWCDSNSDDRTHKVGQKNPNAWGLYDMHGNVAEWVLDTYTPDGYAQASDQSIQAADAINWPTQPYTVVVRGGSWASEPEECRSSSRMGSDYESWKDQDPDLPPSPWWCTTFPSNCVGFRIIRPLDPPQDRDSREAFWKAGHEDIELEIEIRLSQQRGGLGLIDKDLPQAIESLKKAQ